MADSPEYMLATQAFISQELESLKTFVSDDIKRHLREHEAFLRALLKCAARERNDFFSPNGEGEQSGQTKSTESLLLPKVSHGSLTWGVETSPCKTTTGGTISPTVPNSEATHDSEALTEGMKYMISRHWQSARSSSITNDGRLAGSAANENQDTVTLLEDVDVSCTHQARAHCHPQVPSPAHVKLAEPHRSQSRAGKNIGRPHAGMLRASRQIDEYQKRQKRRTEVLAATENPCSRKVQQIICSDKFELVICLLLVANGISIGAQTDYEALNPGKPTPMAYVIIDFVFCLIFSLELAMRLLTYRSEFFRIDGWQFNCFDMFCVAVQIVDIILTLASASFAQNDAGAVLRIVRIMRLVRSLRVARMIRFVQELRKLVFLIIETFSGFLWTLFLLTLLIYLVSVLLTQAISNNLSDAAAHGVSIKNAVDLRRYFPSVLGTSYSLFRAISGGTDWEELSNPLLEEQFYFSGLLLLFYVSMSMMVVLNLVTGLFVDGARCLNHKDKEFELCRKIYSIFDKELARDGMVTMEDFMARAETPEMDAICNMLQCTRDDAPQLFRIIDSNGRGELTPAEFAKGALDLHSEAKNIDIFCLGKSISDLHSDLMLLREGLDAQSTPSFASPGRPEVSSYTGPQNEAD